ncbi:hypothetical protein [Sorangium sp. So ce385]|uniref:hypothetical protein n=1 Tax=Sorangium sp. So ce385 TaxID=3133308 RepID=UPI003F5C8E41
MTDPERLLDKKEGDLQTALLRAALDESPPSGLTRRTLAALGVATAATLAGSAAEAGASGVAAGSAAAGGAAGSAAAGSAAAGSAAAGSAAAGGAAAGGAAAGGAAAGGAAAGAALKVAGVASGGGILSALGIGALAGVLTLGVVQWTGVTAPARRSQEAPAAPAAPEHPPAEAPAALAPPPASGAAEAEPQRAAEERADEGPPLSGPAAPGPAAPGRAAPAKAAPAATSPRAPERNASTLASELALLDTARRALRSGDPAAALAQLDRHAREFADAQLADEAAAIRVEALASKGDRAGARAAARRFLEAHPGSPHADRVESAAGIGAREETVIRRSEPGD